jgi:hypothetical protein
VDDRTKDINALSWLPPEQLPPSLRAKLIAMALNGDTIVVPLAGSDPRTPEGRARKEREDRDKRYAQTMAQIEERRQEFLRDLHRREQACIEALHENEEQLREARQELQKIRDRAYEITLPDGTTTKVYRDGDKVRMESGAEVSRDVVKAEDLGSHSTWSERVGAFERVDKLELDRLAMEKHRQKLGEAREASLTADEFGELRDDLNKSRPESVAAIEAEAQPSPREQSAAPEKTGTPKLGQRFAAADTSRPAADTPPVLSDADFETIRKPSSVSSPGAR